VDPVWSTDGRFVVYSGSDVGATFRDSRYGRGRGSSAAGLESGALRQLTKFAAGFDIRDFDISPDARGVVMKRVQRSDVVLLNLSRP
jgi:hypothetical protein